MSPAEAAEVRRAAGAFLALAHAAGVVLELHGGRPALVCAELLVCQACGDVDPALEALAENLEP